MKIKVLVFYDYFTPAYKAGGPTQSVTNLVRHLHQEFDFYVFTTNQDHDGTVLQVDADKWIDFEGKAKVFYASKTNRNLTSVKEAINSIQPDTVYINGMYSPLCVVYPLMALRAKPQIKVVIAPRGMLQQGALQLKSLKKKIFLNALKLITNRRIYGQATDHQEFVDIPKTFKRWSIVLAGNIPSSYMKLPAPDSQNEIRFVSVSLIARKKNHHQFIEALSGISTKKTITYDIYGPVKDEEYYDVICKYPSTDNVKINYKGPVQHEHLSEIYKSYHYYVLPTLGENFGHSIFEAMMMGKPVIISDRTPWQQLEAKQAGWSVSLSDNSHLIRAIKEAVKLPSETYELYCQNARKIAMEYVEGQNFSESYKTLFDPEK